MSVMSLQGYAAAQQQEGQTEAGQGQGQRENLEGQEGLGGSIEGQGDGGESRKA